MKPANRTPLIPLDLCTLIAYETVALLNADAEALDTAAQLRETLAVLAAANSLDEKAEPLLAWIDWEVESAKRFAVTGKDTPCLIEPERLLPVPDAYTQLDAVWIMFRTAGKCTCELRHTLFNAARTLTEIGGLEDMLLTTQIPDVGFLNAEGLHVLLDEVHMALQVQEHAAQTAGEAGVQDDKETSCCAG